MADHLDRRTFVLGASALAAAIVGDAPEASAEQTPGAGNPAEAAPDPIALLNTRFRELYAANREELLAAAPLAAVMLIGTGEVWRLEHGRPVRSYAPIPWIVKAKGLMHAVIATQATAARLVRAQDVAAARADTTRLTEALATAQELIAAALLADLAPSARAVMAALRQLADGWGAGRPATANDFSDALQKVQPDLKRVLTAAGEAVYESVVAGLRKFASESDPQEWQSCLVGVCGVGFARRDNIEIAAAMSVMGRDVVGTRLLYFENAFTIPAGVVQIGASLADLALGRDVFGDPYRMWRDLFSDVAVAHAGGGFFPETGR
ncbi:MAG TPA: hypothetical protein VGM05_09665 [Planctomycetaceae bacterium]|jgi:hypothetical protein